MTSKTNIFVVTAPIKVTRFAGCGSVREMKFVVRGEEAVLVMDDFEPVCTCCIGNVDMTDEGYSKLVAVGVRAIAMSSGTMGGSRRVSLKNLSHEPDWFYALRDTGMDSLRLGPEAHKEETGSEAHL